MAGVNKVILVGRLGRDPEVRNFQNGGKVVNLRLATSENWKDKATGERKEKTEWHSVAIFNENAARFAEQYLKKGSKVYVEGQLETRKWQDQSGQDRYSTEVVIRPFTGQLTSLDGRGSGGEGGGVKCLVMEPPNQIGGVKSSASPPARSPQRPWRSPAATSQSEAPRLEGQMQRRPRSPSPSCCPALRALRPRRRWRRGRRR